jgi:hypothetical protein
MDYDPDTEGIEDAEDFDLSNATEESVLSEFGPEALGIALGFGEEMALDKEEELRTLQEEKEEADAISLEQNKRTRMRKIRKKVTAQWFETWVYGVIDGTIDLNDRYPDIQVPSPDLDDPM